MSGEAFSRKYSTTLAVITFVESTILDISLAFEYNSFLVNNLSCLKHSRTNNSDVYSKPCQTSKVNLFMKIANG